jgi:hypothetical protein
MAINEAVNVKVDVQGTQNVKKAGEEFSTLQQVANQTSEGLNAAAKSTTLMGEATGKLKEKLNEASGNFTKLKTDLSAIPGPVGMVVQGFTGLNTAFKAIIANPIGLLITAIVLALTGLFKILTSTKAGAEKFQQVLDGLGAAIDVVRDRLLKVGSAIVQFFSGDFKGAFSEAKGAVSGLTDEIAREAKEAANLRKELQNVTDSERELNKSRAEQNKLIANARLVLEDENASYAQRKKALEDVTKSEKQLAKEEENLTTRRFKAIAAQNALSDSSKEALDAEANAYIALQAAQENTLRVQRKLAKEAEALEKEEAAKRKQAAEERKAQQKAQQQERARIAKEQKDAREKQLEEEFQLQQAQDIANYEYQQKLAEERLKQEEEEFQAWQAQEIANYEYRTQLAEKEAEEEKARKQAVADLEQKLFDESQALANAVISLAGEQSKIGKAVALASIAADTAKALTSALANSQSPTPDNVATGGLAGIAKYIALATTILTNSKRAYDIIKAPAPSGATASGGGASLAAATSVPTFQAPSVRLGVQGEQFTQVNRVYVTEADISGTQNRVKVTEGISTI